MICPICKGVLKKKTNKKKIDEEASSVLEEFSHCTQCQSFQYESIGPGKTIWIGAYEFYGLSIYDTSAEPRLKMAILFTKVQYKIKKIGRFLQKLLKLLDK